MSTPPNKHLAAIFSDLHIHNYRQFNNDNSRLKNCIQVLFDILDFCKANGIRTVLMAGDIYDQQKVLPVAVINETIAAFVKIAKDYPEITIYAIDGNHDHATKNLLTEKAVSSTAHLEMVCPNFILVSGRTIELDGNITLSGIPYYEYKEHFDSELTALDESIKDDDFHYLMIHQTPKSITNSMIPYECNPSDIRFSKFAHVFCGHIHKHQQLAQNFTVVGSPIHRDMGDIGETKGFLVMNLANPAKGYKFIPLVGYPEFKNEAQASENDFVVPTVELPAELSNSIDTAQFQTNLKGSQILENYWKEVDGEDTEKLAVGLSLINDLE